MRRNEGPPSQLVWPKDRVGRAPYLAFGPVAGAVQQVFDQIPNPGAGDRIRIAIIMLFRYAVMIVRDEVDLRQAMLLESESERVEFQGSKEQLSF